VCGGDGEREGEDRGRGGGWRGGGEKGRQEEGEEVRRGRGVKGSR